MAVSPLAGAAPEENGETLFWWNLVGLPPVDSGRGGTDIPLMPFPALDGKFDLQITAGKPSDQQVILKKIPAAPASGHLLLPLTPDQHDITVVAIDPATGATRWTQSLDLSETGGGLPVSVPEEEMRARGFEKLGTNGPGDLPAWKIRFSGKEPVDLVDRPWNGTESVNLGAWVGGRGRLKLRCLDAAGKELDAGNSFDLTAWDSPLPIWQFRSLRVPGIHGKIPGSTVRLVLSASTFEGGDGPRDFAISNVRMQIGAPVPLPQGFQRVTRVSGNPDSLVASPDGKYLAIAFRTGKLVTVDLATLAITEISNPDDFQETTDTFPVLAWTTAGLRVFQSNGILYRLDESGTKLEAVIPVRKKSERGELGYFRISDDAKWTILPDLRHHLVLKATDGSVSREITTSLMPRYFFADGGIFMIDSKGQNFRLKTADFAAGDVEEINEPTPPPPRPSDLWKDKIRFNFESGDFNDDENPPPQSIAIPTSARNTDFTADGTLYYIDAAGNVVSAKPLPR